MVKIYQPLTLDSDHFTDLAAAERKRAVAAALSDAAPIRPHAKRSGDWTDEARPQKRPRSPTEGEAANGVKSVEPAASDRAGFAWPRPTARSYVVPVQSDPDLTAWNSAAGNQYGQHATRTSSATPDHEKWLKKAGPLIRQAEAKPISQEQVVAEVKGIYTGLCMVESKCIEVDSAQNVIDPDDPHFRLNNEQWQALIAIHRTLLNEHHDFFLASQHPSASPDLLGLALKYTMPARMWRHGIHSFLELLRRRLPQSLEHMLTFLYLAYLMMALLFETVPALDNIWSECFGDIGRYHMTIKDKNDEDRGHWIGVSSHWYQQASDRVPTTGRLYHHLATVSRSDMVQEMFFLYKSLCVADPFIASRESINSLFEPELNRSRSGHLPINAYVMINAILFTGEQADSFQTHLQDFLGPLDKHIASCTKQWLEIGTYVAISICCALYGFGSDRNILREGSKSTDGTGQSLDTMMPKDTIEPSTEFQNAVEFAIATDRLVYQRVADTNVLAYMFCRLVFYRWLTRFPSLWGQLSGYPWKELADYLNDLLSSDWAEEENLPTQAKGPSRPLREERALRGIFFAEGDLLPTKHFENEKLDIEKLWWTESMMRDRKEKVLGVAFQLSASKMGLIYDAHAQAFRPALDADLVPSEKENDILPDARQYTGLRAGPPGLPFTS